MRKLTQAEAEKWFEERGSKLYSKYENAKSPVIFKCTLCSQQSTYGTWNLMIFRNKECWCSECREKIKVAKDTKYTKEAAEKYLSEQGLKLISFGPKQKVIFTCKICGNPTSRYSPKLFMGPAKKETSLYCEVCIHEEVYKKQHLIPREEVEKWFKEQGSELIKYSNSQETVYYRCTICKKEARYSTFSNLKKLNPTCKCKKCSFILISNKRRLNIKELNIIFKENDSEIHAARRIPC